MKRKERKTNFLVKSSVFAGEKQTVYWGAGCVDIRATRAFYSAAVL